MKIMLNGGSKDVGENTTVQGLLGELELEDGAIAVAVNCVFVPRSEHATHALVAGDEIELVAPMQGG